jgi:hypothetical protein
MRLSYARAQSFEIPSKTQNAAEGISLGGVRELLKRNA